MSAMTLGRTARSLSSWIAHNADLSFAILLAVSVYTYFALTNGLFATHNTAFAILERFAVLGPVALSLTLCIIAGEIDLSVGSNAALTAVIVCARTYDRHADRRDTGIPHRVFQSPSYRAYGRHSHAASRRRAVCRGRKDCIAD